LTRRRSSQGPRRDQHLLPPIQQLEADHPFWGDRRIRAYLHFVERLPVNKKRILRLMRGHHLLVRPKLRLKAKRTPTGSQPTPTGPNEWGGIDLTKVLVEGCGWVYIVLVLDWDTKKSVGSYAGTRCTTQHWLTALDMAVNRQLPNGARGQGLSLLRDNGGQPTAVAVIEACATLEIHRAFTSYNNPNGNADTERARRTRKGEGLWLGEWRCPLALVSALQTWIAYYHEQYLHAVLGYKPPLQYEREYYSCHSPPFAAA
jgi:putative transposase